MYARGERLHWRQRLFLLINEPASSRRALVVAYIMWFFLAFWAFVTITESVTFVTDRTGPTAWLLFRYSFNVLFTLEGMLRVLSHYPVKRALKDAFFYLDVLTITPFWLRLIVHPTSLREAAYLDLVDRSMSIRVLEALSSFRLLKLCRYYECAASLTLARTLTSATQHLP